MGKVVFFSRRWLRFSPPTLLVMEALIATSLAWLSHERQVVCERNAYRDAIVGNWTVTIDQARYYGPNDAYVQSLHLPGSVSIPFVRRCLGDQAIVLLCAEGCDVERARRLFPEAVVVEDPKEFVMRVVADDPTYLRSRKRIGSVPRKILAGQ